MQRVQVVAVLLDEEVARQIAAAKPIAQLIHLGVRVGHALERVGVDPETARVDELADAALLQPLVSFEVGRPVALLEAEEETLLRVGLAPGRHHTLAARQIDARGLLAVDMLARLHHGGQHPRMLERRRRADHGVQIGGEPRTNSGRRIVKAVAVAPPAVRSKSRREAVG